MKTIALLSVNAFKPLLTDGASRTMWELLQAIGRRGHQSMIINYFTNDPPLKRNFECLRHEGNSRSRGGSNSYNAQIRDIVCYQNLLACSYDEVPRRIQEISSILYREIQKKGVDIAVSIEDDHPSSVAIHLSEKKNAQFFHSQRGVDGAAQDAMLTRLTKKAAQVYAASSCIQYELLRLLGVTSQVWYPYIDFEQYLLSAPYHGKSIGFYTSGLHKGDAIVERIIEMNPDRKLLIVGRRPEFLSEGSPSNVRYLGFVSDMRALYSKISLLLVPSVIPEAFSRVITEAACNGIPTIANRVGGVPEAVGEGGITIEVDRNAPIDVEEMARIYSREIRNILDDPDLLNRYGEKAREGALKYQLRQEAMLDNFLESVVGP
jgi:glycosyltransferase involved in cell wall biosynthesis